MIFDTIERVGASELHHGRLNDRVFLKELHQDDLGNVLERVESLTREKKYGKIVGKVPHWALDFFLDQGYRVEAEIPGLFKGDTDGYFLAGYPNEQRVHREEKEERFIESVKTIALATSDTSPKIPYDGLEVKVLAQADLDSLAALHEQALGNYPYPISDTAYLEKCLEEGFEFYGLFREAQLLESAIVHYNDSALYGEIIDFAIPNGAKGQNLSYHLLAAIKLHARKKAIKTLYSSIRATSYGLNITFKKQGFHFGGTLVNNTRVGDHLESMNIWYLNNPGGNN